MHVVPDSERVSRAVPGDSRFAPSAPVQRLGPRPDFARAAGIQAITVRTGARSPLQERTRRCRDAGSRARASDQARMREPVPPSLPIWHHLFPPGPRAARRLCPVPGLTCRPSCSDAPRASESVAPRFTGPVPPGRFRSGVQSTRADQVRAEVGRGPASPHAACLVGGAVVRVTSPGRPRGRGDVHASAYPGPVGITSQRRPGRDTTA